MIPKWPDSTLDKYVQRFSWNHQADWLSSEILGSSTTHEHDNMGGSDEWTYNGTYNGIPSRKQKRTSGGPQFTTFLKMHCFEVCYYFFLYNIFRNCCCYPTFSLNTKTFFFSQKANLIDYIELLSKCKVSEWMEQFAWSHLEPRGRRVSQNEKNKTRETNDQRSRMQSRKNTFVKQVISAVMCINCSPSPGSILPSSIGDGVDGKYLTNHNITTI